MAIEKNVQQDEHIEQLWYMKEQGKTSLDFFRKSMKHDFDPLVVEELARRGLIEQSVDPAVIKLTADGEARACQLIRAHRLAERLIADVLGGGDLEQVACEFEHTVSLELVNGICTLLGHPKECPHGMPIPEGDCCKLAKKAEFSFIIPLADLKLGESARIAYIHCKNDQQVHKLEGLCIRPGIVVKLHQNYPAHVIECEGASIALDREVVAHISVWKNFQGHAAVPLPKAACLEKNTVGGFGKLIGRFFRNSLTWRKFGSGILFCALGVFSSAGYLHAAPSGIEALMQEDITRLLDTPVTISSRIPEKLESVPAAVTVISAEDIERSGYTQVWDLLRKVPGVNVAQLSANTVGVSIRGFNDKYSNMVQVLQDGRSIFNPITQGVWWIDQPIFLEDIERIEVMRGPNAVMYGYNSFNGVINIKTKPPSMTKGFKAVTTVGLGKDQQYYSRVGDSVGKLDYRLSVQADRSQGFGGDDGKQYIDGSRLNACNIRTTYHLAEGRDIEWLAGSKTGTRGLEPDVANTAGATDMDYQMFKYNHRPDPDAGFNVQMSRTFWNIDLFKVKPSVHDVAYRQYDLEFQHDFKPLYNHKIVWGGGYRWNEGRDNYFVDPSRDYRDVILRGFLQDSMDVTDLLSLHSGVEWAKNNYTGADYSFRETAMYDLGQEHFIRATVARATHAHGFFEYHVNIPFAVTGNPDLETTTVMNYELGYRGAFIDRKVFFDTAVFLNDLQKIRNATAAHSFLNENSADVYGLETGLEWIPWAWLKGYTNYTCLFVNDTLDQYNTQDPRNRVNAGATLFTRKYAPIDYIDARYSYVGAIDTLSEQGPSAPKIKDPRYHKVDLKVARKIYGGSGEVSVSAENLLAPHHLEFGNQVNVDRRYYLTLKVEF